MKKFFCVAVVALALTACGNTTKEKVATDCVSEDVATAVVPAAATEVLPAASPVSGLGKVATDVVPAE